MGVERQPRAAAAGGGELEDGQQRLAAQAGAVGCGERADLDLLDLLEALGHDFHVGRDDGFAELAELLDVLLVDDFAILLLGDAELVEQAADGEECAEEGVALHAELEIAAVGGFLGDGEAGQREDANVLVDDLLAGPMGQTLPGLLAFFIGLPNQRAAFGHAVERVAVGEGFGVAAENDGHVAQIAVDADAVFGGDHEVRGWRALFLRTVFGIGADVDDFLGIAELVALSRPARREIVEVADDCAEIFAGGDGAPSADGVEADGDCAFGKQGGRFFADDRVGVVDAEDEEGDTVGGALAIFAGAAGGGELVCADDVLGAEVARAEAVSAGKDAGALRSWPGRAGLPGRDGLQSEWPSRARCGCRGRADCRRRALRRCARG